MTRVVIGMDPHKRSVTIEVMAPVLDTQRVGRPPTRPVTRFEQRGLAAGRASYDVVGVRRDPGRDRLHAQRCPPT